MFSLWSCTCFFTVYIRHHPFFFVFCLFDGPVIDSTLRPSGAPSVRHWKSGSVMAMLPQCLESVCVVCHSFLLPFRHRSVTFLEDHCGGYFTSVVERCPHFSRLQSVIFVKRRSCAEDSCVCCFCLVALFLLVLIDCFTFSHPYFHDNSLLFLAGDLVCRLSTALFFLTVFCVFFGASDGDIGICGGAQSHEEAGRRLVRLGGCPRRSIVGLTWWRTT